MATGTLTLSKSVICADLNDEAVLLNVDTGVYFGLDALGSRIWKLIEHQRDEEEIVATLLEEYDVDRPRLEADLELFLGELQRHGLVGTAQG